MSSTILHDPTQTRKSPMTWNPERIAKLRRDRRETQAKFGKAVGVDRTTVSEWENGRSAVSALNGAALDALANGPRDTSRDFERGVLYACEAMSETIARLLREQREAADAKTLAEAAAERERLIQQTVAAANRPSSAAPARRRRKG